jgi:hypothetical protein
MGLSQGNGELRTSLAVSLTTSQRLAFAPEPQVDGIFAKLAHSLISGELCHSKASQVRVTTRPAADPESGPQQHNLSIYFPNVYDEDMARDVRV